MLSRETTIQNSMGFHLRPAQLFVDKANEFESDITVKNEEGMETDGKSILGLMTMGYEFGSRIIVEADGADEAAAVEALIELIVSKFGEE
jgi:phosphocarrier protein HPr/phosphocarrier protein